MKRKFLKISHYKIFNYVFYNYLPVEFFRTFFVILCLITIFSNANGVPQKQVEKINSPSKLTATKADTVIKSKDSLMILSVHEISTKTDTARLDETIAFKIKSTRSIDSTVVLLIDGLEATNSFKIVQNCNHTIIYFRINEQVRTALSDYLEHKPFERVIIPIDISIKDLKSNLCAINPQKFYLVLKLRIKHTLVWVVVSGLIILILIIISLKNNVLKGDSNTYYSLGRSQLFFWTIVAVSCYLIIWFKREEIPDLNSTLLIILGISVGTTAASKLIENEDAGLIPQTPIFISKGFLIDILSDGSGISVNRFQNVVFNIVFGLIFFQKAIATDVFPNFDANVLLLMGISSTAYAGLKIIEKGKETGTTTGNSTTTVSDEIYDEDSETNSAAKG